MDDNRDDEVKKYFESMAENFRVKLPKRVNKTPLTPEQKKTIREWTAPGATTSAKCSSCGGMFSLGYLRICDADSTKFCSKTYHSYATPKQGYTDDELEFCFGITRDELEED